MSSLNFDFDVVTGPSLATCSNLPEDPEVEAEVEGAPTSPPRETTKKAAA